VNLQSKVSESGKIERRAIPDLSMVRDVVSALKTANERRHTIGARILSKLNSTPPHDAAKLKQEGLGWKANFSTRPLGVLVERVVPRLVQVIDEARYLTSSRLPAEFPDSFAKTDFFRSSITAFVRENPEWRVLLEQFALNTALFGYSAALILDEYSVFPEVIPFEDLYIADGTPQVEGDVQLLVVRERYRPHELFALIENREAAKEAGWIIKDVIETINQSFAEGTRERYNGLTEALWYEAAKRELSTGVSYISGTRPITCFSVLVAELNGKVSHYRLAEGTDKVIFSRDDRFDSFRDILVFSTFRLGDGKVLSSRGMGRDLYDVAAVIDRIRCELVDRLSLSGKVMIKGDPRDLQRLQMSVIGNLLVIPANWELVTDEIRANPALFTEADGYIRQLLDEMVGAASPKFLKGERVTSQQINLFAAREEEVRDAYNGRFLTSVAKLVGLVQRRLLLPTTDASARRLLARLRTRLTDEEIVLLCNSPSISTVRDFTAAERMILSQFASEQRGNPLFNQRALATLDVAARLGPDYVDAVLQPDPDPVQQAEQIRMQQLENKLLSEGQTVPVSARDAHEVHLGIWRVAVESFVPRVIDEKLPAETLYPWYEHGAEHVKFLRQAKVSFPALDDIEKFLIEFGKMIQKLSEMEKAAIAEAQAKQAAVEGGVPGEASAEQPAGAPAGIGVAG